MRTDASRERERERERERKVADIYIYIHITKRAFKRKERAFRNTHARLEE